MASRIPARLSTAELRRFGLLVGPAFGVLGGFLWWRGAESAAIVAWGLGGLLLLFGLLFPAVLGPVHRAWMGLAHALSKVTTPIVMGAMYYLVLTPTGLIARAFGHRPLTRKGPDSFWIERAADQRRSDMTRQF